MVALIHDRELERRLIRYRRRTGADRFDEVWEGTYVMAPGADNQHQYLSFDLGMVFGLCIDRAGLGRSVAAVNVSDREHDWMKNFRVPDLAVFLSGTAAIEHHAFWHGGPDFVVEISSPEDRTDEKIPFYDEIGTKELLIIDRDPWRLRLFRRIGTALSAAETSTLESSRIVRSEVIPLSFSLGIHENRTVLRLTHHDGAGEWLIVPSKDPMPRPGGRRSRKKRT